VLGETIALVSGIAYAAAAILSAKALREVDPVRLNSLRFLSASVFAFLLVVLTGDINKLPQVDAKGLLLVILSAIIGIAVGDTLLYKSFTLIGVSRAYMIAYSHPLFTTILAILFLGESFSLVRIAGTIAILSSVVAALAETRAIHKKPSSKGLVMAIVTALLYAVGTIVATLGVREVSIPLANAMRYPVLGLLMFFLSQRKRARASETSSIGKTNFALISISGLVGLFIGGSCSLLSFQLLGAARASPLVSSSPVWVSIMSTLILREKATFRLFLSTGALVLGIFFLAI
jgi:drug/metabolite transporter (DMT)-like permease